MNPLDDLNFHHLRYFWVTAREGGVTAAATALGVGQPVVSAQLKRLERHFKQKLFEKHGRGMRLTEFGQTVFDYAEDIFRLGRELCHAAAGDNAGGRSAVLRVGVADAMPKLIVYKLLEPVYALPDPVRLVCAEDRPATLLVDLAAGNLDLVLTDGTESVQPRGDVFRHPLGECGITFFAAGPLAAKLRRDFPASLDAAPVLLPTPDAALRRSLDGWFVRQRVRPEVRGEFADSALLKVFGQAGRGAFALPTVIEADVTAQFDVVVVARVEVVRERYFAVTGGRKLTHPAVIAVRDAARHDLFG